jgi:hypothetical protein
MTDLDPNTAPTELSELDRERALVDLIRVDYDATLRALSSFVSTGGQIRTIGVGLWGVLFGLAIQRGSLSLALVATAVSAIFAYGDAFHSALYRATVSRAIRLEMLLDDYVDRLGIDADDANAVLRTRAKLEMHRFGVQKAIKRPGWRALVAGRPHFVFRAMYPTFFAVSVAVSVAYGVYY